MPNACHCLVSHLSRCILMSVFKELANFVLDFEKRGSSLRSEVLLGVGPYQGTLRNSNVCAFTRIFRLLHETQTSKCKHL